MSFRRRSAALATVVAALVTTLGATVAPEARAASDTLPFPVLQAPFTQQLYATFAVPDGAYAGGLAFAPGGTLLAAICRGPSQVHRLGGTPVQRHGSSVLPDQAVTTGDDVGCGLVNGPDGVYANAATGGVVRLDPETGAVLARAAGPAGNGLGIAYDPHGGRFLYAAAHGLAWVSADLTRSGTFASRSAYDGVYLDPSGAFVFAADGEAVDILDQGGNLVQRVEHTAGPGGPTDGVAFHGTDGFVVTNNTDGTITRLDFPDRDYAKPPVQTVLASGGFRGDLVQVGPDSCLYVTQSGSRYADGTVTTEQSVVQICGGFVAPPATPAPGFAALGDGFTSGEGAGGYLPASDTPSPHNSCHRSAAGYPQGLATAQNLADPVVAACSHARISDLLAPNTSGQLTSGGAPEPAQLDAVGSGTQLVTLTVGAADLGLDSILTECVRGDVPRVRARHATPWIPAVLQGHPGDPGHHDDPHHSDPGHHDDPHHSDPGHHDDPHHSDPGHHHDDPHHGDPSHHDDPHHSDPGHGPAGGCADSSALAARTDAALAALAGGASPSAPSATPSVAELLTEITRRAPHARIVLAGYPMPFGTSCPAEGCRAGHLTPTSGRSGAQIDAVVSGADAQWIDRTIARLNDVLATAAAAVTQATYTGVTSAFAGHGLCDRSQPWLNPVTGTVRPDGTVAAIEPASLHPTATGQDQGYLAALSA
jgi:hypothetical protein